MPRHLGRIAAIAAVIVSVAGSVAAAARATAATPPGGAVAVTSAVFPGEASSGWALGTAGGATAVWHTSNAGRSWQVQWRGSGAPLALTATSVTQAWALTGCAEPARCGRQLLGTSDRGRHWRVLATFGAAVNWVQFATASLGVAVSDPCLIDPALSRCPGSVLVSHDGGVHWAQVLSQPAPVFAVAAASGRLWAARTSAAAIRFVTSTDGGRTWRPLGALAGLGPLSPDVRVALALSRSGGLAWASVFDQLSCSMRGCVVADLVASATDGRTWATVNLPAANPDGCGNAGVTLAVAADGAAWAATSRNGAACPPPLGPVYVHTAAGWRTPPPWRLTAITALSAVSARTAYAIGEHGKLSRTVDGGQHWTGVQPAAEAGGARLTAGGARLTAGGARLTAGGTRLSAGGARFKAGGTSPGGRRSPSRGARIPPAR